MKIIWLFIHRETLCVCCVYDRYRKICSSWSCDFLNGAFEKLYFSFGILFVEYRKYRRNLKARLVNFFRLLCGIFLAPLKRLLFENQLECYPEWAFFFLSWGDTEIISNSAPE